MFARTHSQKFSPKAGENFFARVSENFKHTDKLKFANKYPQTKRLGHKNVTQPLLVKEFS